MDPRTLQLIQRGLVAAVTVVLALVVITAFLQVIQPTNPETVARSTTTGTPTSAPETTSTTTTTMDTATTTTSDVTAAAICVEPEPAGNDSTVLQVFYPCGSTDVATGGTYVYRTVPPTDLVLTTTLREMVKGLEADESALGFKSPFPDGAAGSFLGVSISQGTAFIEFTPSLFPEGADTPEGAQILLSTLNANVFQFSTISAVEYRLNGSCDAFYQQLGSTCQEITRSQWRASLTTG